MKTDSFRLKGIVAEDFVNYKEPSTFLVSSFCDWKCCREGNFDESVCQNNELAISPIQEFTFKQLTDFYLNNPISKALVIGGLEPFMQWEELKAFIGYFRAFTDDTIVIYTGYKEDELVDQISYLNWFDNIIIKFGRYIPNQKPHYDSILGVELASDNQYAKYIK